MDLLMDTSWPVMTVLALNQPDFSPERTVTLADLMLKSGLLGSLKMAVTNIGGKGQLQSLQAISVIAYHHHLKQRAFCCLLFPSSRRY